MDAYLARGGSMITKVVFFFMAKFLHFLLKQIFMPESIFKIFFLYCFKRLLENSVIWCPSQGQCVKALVSKVKEWVWVLLGFMVKCYLKRGTWRSDEMGLGGRAGPLARVAVSLPGKTSRQRLPRGACHFCFLDLHPLPGLLSADTQPKRLPPCGLCLVTLRKTCRRPFHDHQKSFTSINKRINICSSVGLDRCSCPFYALFYHIFFSENNFYFTFF